MKLIKVAICFVCVVFPWVILVDMLYEKELAVLNQKYRMQLCLQAAVDDAADALVEQDRGQVTIENCEHAADAFEQSFVAACGVLQDEVAKQNLLSCIPVILIVNPDGCFIRTFQWITANKQNFQEKVWSEKIPYLYPWGDWNCYLTLGDELYAENRVDGQVWGGTLSEWIQFTSNLCVSDELRQQAWWLTEEIEEQKKVLLTNLIREQLEYHVNQYNEIAKRNQVTYQFYLPYLPDHEWYRCIEETGFYVFYEGTPLKGQNGHNYLHSVFAGARIRKSQSYVVCYPKESDEPLLLERSGEQESITSNSLYHRVDCKEIEKATNRGEYLEIYTSKRECAMQGAYPCQKCKP